MAGAVGAHRDVSRAPAPLFKNEIDRKSPYFHLDIEGTIYLENPMQTRKKVADCACGQSRGMGLMHLRYGYATYTFGPAGCVAASRKLRNEGERPTGHPETMAGAVGMQRDVSRAPAPLFVAEHDRKSPYFYLEIKGSIFLGNPMQTRKKVADCACGQSRGMGLMHLRYGYATYTFGPAGCVAASRKLRNEGERPTGHPETMAGAVGMQRDVSRAPAPLFVAERDGKSHARHFFPGFQRIS